VGRGDEMVSEYLFTILVIVGIYVILTQGLDIILGYAGQPSLGHAAFWGIGAYTAAILATQYNISFWLTVPIACFVTGLAGLGIGLPVLRLRKDFFVITTIGVNFVIQAFFLYSPFFGGTYGIGGIPPPQIFDFRISASSSFFVIVLISVIVCTFIKWRLSKTWMGLTWKAIRENDFAAGLMGVNITKFKLFAFIIGTAYAGLAGGIYAHFIGYISPSYFNFSESIIMLTMVVFGGTGTIWGVIIGATVLGTFPEIFRFAFEYRLMIYGLLLIITMRFQPSGLLGSDSFIRRKVAVILENLK
jgi:branched-chain amino acid transport system permease protein